jgi:small redox-active disulfide protein 2
MKMEIKILGSGCPNCKRLEALAHEVVDDLGIGATFTKVTSPAEIMAYDIVSTPALVIDETVVSSGRVPRKDEIAGWIEAIEHIE